MSPVPTPADAPTASLRELAADFRQRAEQTAVAFDEGGQREDECDSPAECHASAQYLTWKLAARALEKLISSPGWVATAAPEPEADVKAAIQVARDAVKEEALCGAGGFVIAATAVQALAAAGMLRPAPVPPEWLSPLSDYGRHHPDYYDVRRFRCDWCGQQAPDLSLAGVVAPPVGDTGDSELREDEQHHATFNPKLAAPSSPRQEG